jgi:hypothetical protein
MTLQILQDARGKIIGLLGPLAAIDAYLSSDDEAAEAMAQAVFADPDALAEFELGQSNFPAPVGAALDRLIADRNAYNPLYRERA